jgi:hypothetical protein
MELLGHWRRRAFGAAGATVIAPAAVILAALTVGVAGGGLKGLGSLGQALTGPQLPVAAASETTKKARSKQANEPSRLLAEAENAREQTDQRLARSQPDQTSTGPTARTPGREPGSGNTPGTRPGGNTNNPPASGGGQPPQPPPQGNPEPSVIRQTGNQVKGVVEPVPVVGETGAAVVEELVTTADELCPPPVCPQK